MAEDWRVTIELEHEGHAAHLVGTLPEVEVEDEIRRELGDRVAVSSDGDTVFLYADTGDAAEAARRVAEQALAHENLHGTLRLDRWHHEEEEWVDASVPLPSTPQAEAAEHRKLEAEETAESKASGLAAWEVRVELASHHDAHALAEQLATEGYEPVRRWRYLLVGTADEDDADALAKRLQAEAPKGATVHVEPGGGTAWQLMPRNPFAVFGGLGA